MAEKALIIGITGAFGSGKSTAADFFAESGFTHLTLSAFLEEEATNRGAEKITRKLLQDLGNELREKHGKGVLAKKALAFIHEQGLHTVIIDGIRNVGELEELYKQPHFVLIGVVANRDVRFERLQKVKRREDLTNDLFLSLDYRDLGIGEKETGLQVAYCLALADYFVLNNSSKEEFLAQLKNVKKKVEETV